MRAACVSTWLGEAGAHAYARWRAAASQLNKAKGAHVTVPLFRARRKFRTARTCASYWLSQPVVDQVLDNYATSYAGQQSASYSRRSGARADDAQLLAWVPQTLLLRSEGNVDCREEPRSPASNCQTLFGPLPPVVSCVVLVIDKLYILQPCHVT